MVIGLPMWLRGKWPARVPALVGLCRCKQCGIDPHLDEGVSAVAVEGHGADEAVEVPVSGVTPLEQKGGESAEVGVEVPAVPYWWRW